MRPQEDIDAAKIDEHQLNQIAMKGGAALEFAAAIRSARQACAEAGLDLTFDEHGRASLSEFQVHKTLRHTREDVAASLMLQHSIMRRLDRNRNYMFAIILLMLYIATQVG